ncbi:MAG: hypothetical protein O7H39_10930 [Gammaproteobacteria bacterium]|nr:hypothetical protein [Gammaproteobacteria bacterium]
MTKYSPRCYRASAVLKAMREIRHAYNGSMRILTVAILVGLLTLTGGVFANGNYSDALYADCAAELEPGATSSTQGSEGSASYACFDASNPLIHRRAEAPEKTSPQPPYTTQTRAKLRHLAHRGTTREAASNSLIPISNSVMSRKQQKCGSNGSTSSLMHRSMKV